MDSQELLNYRISEWRTDLRKELIERGTMLLIMWVIFAALFFLIDVYFGVSLLAEASLFLLVLSLPVVGMGLTEKPTQERIAYDQVLSAIGNIAERRPSK